MRIYLYQKSINGHDRLFKKYAKDVYMLLLTNGQPFYWSNPSMQVYLPTAEGDSYDWERYERTERILNSFPGKVLRKIYRGLRKIKHTFIH